MDYDEKRLYAIHKNGRKFNSPKYYMLPNRTVSLNKSISLLIKSGQKR